MSSLAVVFVVFKERPFKARRPLEVRVTAIAFVDVLACGYVDNDNGGELMS